MIPDEISERIYNLSRQGMYLDAQRRRARMEDRLAWQVLSFPSPFRALSVYSRDAPLVLDSQWARFTLMRNAIRAYLDDELSFRQWRMFRRYAVMRGIPYFRFWDRWFDDEQENDVETFENEMEFEWDMYRFSDR